MIKNNKRARPKMHKSSPADFSAGCFFLIPGTAAARRAGQRPAEGPPLRGYPWRCATTAAATLPSAPDTETPPSARTVPPGWIPPSPGSGFPALTEKRHGRAPLRRTAPSATAVEEFAPGYRFAPLVVPEKIFTHSLVRFFRPPRKRPLRCTCPPAALAGVSQRATLVGLIPRNAADVNHPCEDKNIPHSGEWGIFFWSRRVIRKCENTNKNH